jgi:hypothetical protein
VESGILKWSNLLREREREREREKERERDNGEIYSKKVFMGSAPGACTIKHYEFMMYGKWTDFVVS